jgi:hypothetical protein
MKRLIIFICLQGIALALFGQNDYLLLVRGKSQQRIRKIPEGKMVNIKPILYNRETLKGKLEILTDSVIAVAGDTILVDNIKRIRIKTTATNVIGGVATTLGLTASIIGIWGIIALTPLDPDSYVTIMEAIGLIFVIPFATGGILYTVIGVLILANGRSYKTFGRHAYSITVAHDQTIILPKNLASHQQKF